MKRKMLSHKLLLCILILPSVFECYNWYFHSEELSAYYSIGILAFIIYDLTD